MIVEKACTEYWHCRIPGILFSGRGNLMAYYECRREESDWAQIDIKIIKSEDEGKHWREVKKVCGNGKTLNNPVMFVKEGTLHFLYCEDYRRVFYIESLDDGESWSEPKEITGVFAESKLQYTVVAVGPGHGITTREGVLVVPCWFANNELDEKAHKPSFIATLYSKDDGVNWNIGEVIRADFLENPSECALGLLKNGKVLISIRNESGRGCRCFAVSENGYAKWENIALDERFIDPICMGSLANGENKIYHINCNSKTERKNLMIRASEDDFSTFTEILVDTCGGYSDLCIRDGKAYVLYEDTNCSDGVWAMNLHFKVVNVSTVMY